MILGGVFGIFHIHSTNMYTVNSASILYFPLCVSARDRGALPVLKPNTIRRYPPAAISNPTLANPAVRDQNVSLVPELTGQSVRPKEARVQDVR